MKNFFRVFPLCVLFLLACLIQPSQAKPLRLFVIGNSFSGNATQYLPQLAEEGGHELIIGRAELGGCTLQRHWEAVAAAEANPADPKGRPYGKGTMRVMKEGGMSLRELLNENTWDVVTIQQASIYSGSIETYRPYARNLYNFIKKLQPQAAIVFHQTWPYRSDATGFTWISKDKHAKDQQEMWRYSHDAYYTVARKLGMSVIPNGDAFWNVANDPKWAYKKDATFDFANPVARTLPDQTNSLNGGYWWLKDKLKFDSHHANTAGRYLGALVWYGFLFHESPENLTFVPPKVPADFAAHLRDVAWQTVKDNKRPLK